MINDNKFKLGLFSPNTWGGLAKTLDAERRWDASWENNVTVARMAEEAGLDFILPFGQWLGLHGESEVDGHTLESMAWAAGVLAVTERISVFGTVHAPFVHPVFAAKQAVTCDHVGGGRFGLNVVSGYSRPEFELFGVEMRDHDERYVYTEEWVTLVKRMWAESEPFDFEGKYFDLRGVMCEPKPFGHERPTLVSAGSSPAGRRFAVRHADYLFMVIVDLDTLGDELAALRALTRERPLSVLSSGHVFCRATAAETEEYYHHIVHERGDWVAADHFRDVVVRGTLSVPPDRVEELLERFVSGHNTFLVKGDPDTVAATFKRMSDAGLDGSAFALVDYIDDFPIIRDEVLPRLERLGLRAPAGRAGLQRV